MENNYFIKNMVEKISRGDSTYFLDNENFRNVSSLLNKLNIKYLTYKPFEASEKNIIYKNKKPKVSIYEIVSNIKLTHPMILGTMYANNIKKEMYGDIIVSDKTYIVLSNINEDFIINNISKIGNNDIKFKKVNFSVVENFTYTFKKIKLQIDSSRLDKILSKLQNKSRSQSIKYIEEKLVSINGKLILKPETKVKEKDILEIRKVGKFIIEEINEKNIVLNKYN